MNYLHLRKDRPEQQACGPLCWGIIEGLKDVPTLEQQRANLVSEWAAKKSVADEPARYYISATMDAMSTTQTTPAATPKLNVLETILLALVTDATALEPALIGAFTNNQKTVVIANASTALLTAIAQQAAKING